MCATLPHSAGRNTAVMSIYDILREQILQGALPSGTRLPSIRELQMQYGVPYRAVRVALLRLESEGLVTCKIGSGTYVKDERSSRCKARAVHKVTVLLDAVPDWPLIIQFLRPLLDAVRDELVACGVEQVKVEHVSDEDIWHKFDPKEGDGVVWVCQRRRHTEAPPPKMPVVIVGHNIDVTWPDETGYDLVAPDYVQGGALAARRLREAGCRNAAILSGRGPYDHIHYLCSAAARRILGFTSAWGSELKGSILHTSGTVPQEGAAKLEEFLSLVPRPDGVFVTCDDLAFGFCHGLIAHGLQPGRDVKVIGCDGQPPRFEGEPRLTTIEAPLDEMGRIAARLAILRAQQPGRLATKAYVAYRIRVGETG